jgi:hypothetical protein
VWRGVSSVFEMRGSVHVNGYDLLIRTVKTNPIDVGKKEQNWYMTSGTLE